MATTTSTSLLSAHSTSNNNGSSNNASTIASSSDESLSAYSNSRAERILVEYETLPQFSSDQAHEHQQQHQQQNLERQRSWSSSSQHQQRFLLHKQSSSATLSVEDALSLNSLLKRQSNHHHHLAHNNNNNNSSSSNNHQYPRMSSSDQQPSGRHEEEKDDYHLRTPQPRHNNHNPHRMDSGGGPQTTPPVRPTRTAEDDYYPTAAVVATEIIGSPPTPTTKHSRAAAAASSKNAKNKGGDFYYPSPLDFPPDIEPADLNWTDGLLANDDIPHEGGKHRSRGHLHQEASPTRSRPQQQQQHPSQDLDRHHASSSAQRPSRDSYPYATHNMDPPPTRSNRPPRRIPKGGLSDPRIMMGLDWQNNNNNNSNPSGMNHNRHSSANIHHNHHATERLMVEETSTVASEARYTPQEVVIQDDYTAVSTISGTAATMEADHLHALLDEVLNVQDSSNSKDLAPRLPRGEEEHNVPMPPDEYANIRRRRPERWTPMERTIETHHRYREPRNYRHGNSHARGSPNHDVPRYGPTPTLPMLQPREPQLSRPPQSTANNISAPSPLAPLDYHTPPSPQIAASSPTTRPPQPHRPLQVEVAQGQYETVRGAQETMTAVNAGIAEVVTCPTCEGAVAVVADCKYVMCPTCRIMFPMPLLDETVGTRYGVGLGLDLRL